MNFFRKKGLTQKMMKGAYRPALYRYYVLMGLRHTHNARAKKEHQQEKKGNKRFQSVFAHSSLYACSALSVTEIIFFQTERDLTRRKKNGMDRDVNLVSDDYVGADGRISLYQDNVKNSFKTSETLQ